MHGMNRPERDCTKFSILFISALFLISCQSAVKSYQTGRSPESEKDAYQQAIHKAYLWIDMHPTSLEIDGPVPILEEIMAFYVLWKNTEDDSLKKTYVDEFRERVELLASVKDYRIGPKEFTSFLTIALFAERLQIDTLDFRRMIEEQIIPSPALFSQNITSVIWNTVYLGRLGYDPPPDLKSLIAQSNLQQEAYHRLLYQAICSPLDPSNMDKMTLTTYHMTHEIFSLTNFGEYPSPPVIENNKAFFLDFFEKAIQWAMDINHVDLLGEMIMCVKMLDLKDVPSLKKGIEYILSSQEDNGTFGITNPSLPNAYRHGILVSMMTLSML